MDPLEELKEIINREILSKGNSAIEYNSVALCFPGGPHPQSFEKRLIYKNGLLKWANAQGFSVNILSDKEYESFENMPCIVFSRK
jgi:hypothetical protein